MCPGCNQKQLLPVPVDLRNPKCDKCGGSLDPVRWESYGPVNHLLMQRLISTCYKHPNFARNIIAQYRRDYDHAMTDEWGIDKSLLAVHAANSIIQRGHRSLVPFLCLLLALSFNIGIWIPPLGSIVVLLVVASRRGRNERHREQFLRIDAYNPTVVPESNIKNIEKLLRFIEDTVPENLYFFSEYNPFQHIGANDDMWSILVDRRKRIGGDIATKPADLDLDSTYSRIIESVCNMRGPGTYPSRFQVKDVVFARATMVDPKDARFIDENYRPRTRVDPPRLADMRNFDDSRYKVFKRITFYDPRRDIGITSFIRLQHQGPFTYVESVGTRLLPVVDKLFGLYTDRTTFTELEKIHSGPKWWRSIDLQKRRRFRFVAILSLITLGIWANPFYPVEPRVLWMNLPHLTFLLTVILATYGFLPKLNGTYQSRKMDETRRHAKEAQEFDFGPTKWSIRYSQSRLIPENFFESTDTRLLRRTQDLAIQEAFLQCLEDAGIDTSDFRQGATQINNYGIINSGEITGEVKTETAGGSKQTIRSTQKTRPEAKKKS